MVLSLFEITKDENDSDLTENIKSKTLCCYNFSRIPYFPERNFMHQTFLNISSSDLLLIQMCENKLIKLKNKVYSLSCSTHCQHSYHHQSCRFDKKD